MRLWRDCRPIRGKGPGGWRWVRGQRLAFWGSQPGLERSIVGYHLLNLPQTRAPRG